MSGHKPFPTSLSSVLLSIDKIQEQALSTPIQYFYLTFLRLRMETITVREMTDIFFPSHGITSVQKLQECLAAPELTRVVSLNLFAFQTYMRMVL